MPTTIEVEDSEVRAAFARLISVGENPRAYLSAIGNVLADNTRLRFGEGRAPDGSTWPPLSPVTAARRRGGKGGQPLIDKGILRNSISVGHGAVNMVVSGDSVTVGTNVRYAAMQHFGARKGAFGRGHYRTRKGSFPIPWGDVPPRPYLGISNEDRSSIINVLARVVTGGS